MPKGDIVHIEGLYVKPQAVKTNIKILKGDLCIFDTDGLRPILTTDFAADNRFLDIGSTPVFQAGHDADNLDSTAVGDRVTQVSVITKGSDLVYSMAAAVKPDDKVGISRLDSRTPVIAISDVANSAEPTIEEVLGIYKHKEFAKLAANSALNDDGVIATGVV